MADAVRPVTWFEIPAVDLERAARFYEQILGVTLSMREMGPSRST